MSVDALRDNVELIDRYFLPMNVEHDIRLPTVGRVVAAEVVELPGGEYALDGVEETFEAGDDLDRVYRGDKVMISGISARDRAVIEYDRMLSGAGGDALLARLLEVTELESHELVKWSMDPIGVLALGAGGIALASTAKGFFQKLGEDAYASLKSVLASEFRRPKLRDRVLTEFHCAV